LEFAKFIKENNIKGNQIFFTDEKRFFSHVKMNPQVNQIRLTKKWHKKLKRGCNEVRDKIYRQIPKFPESFMVAGGISSKGVSELIFCVGTMNSSMYTRALGIYRADLDRLDPNLYFQQDKASCHTSGESRKKIRETFNSWDVDLWPANSPDISPVFKFFKFLD
jgi:hypothetical protein